VLQQIGNERVADSCGKSLTEDLSKYQTIVLGIRAYDTQKDVIANNKRLLELWRRAEDSWCSTTLRQAISMAGKLRLIRDVKRARCRLRKRR